MNPPTNIFDGIPARLDQELIELLLTRPGIRIERIVSRGHTSPPDFWYDQDTDEWVLLLSGAARLEFDAGLSVKLVPGAYLHIPAHQRHRVAWTDPDRDTIWLAIHLT